MSKNSNDLALQKAKFSVYTVFFVLGFIFANWASRFPAVRDLLEYNPAQMGRLLLVGAIGSIIALPLSGMFIERFGASRLLKVASTIFAGGYLIVAISLGNAPVAVVAAGLFIGGFGMGMSDTAINFEGARVERGLKRSIMPRFHGAFSLGTMAGALIGALMAALSVPVIAHIGGTVVIGYILFFNATLKLLPGADRTIESVDVSAASEQSLANSAVAPAAESRAQTPRASVWSEWLTGRTWLLGLIVLAAALTEGAANDWLALGIVDGFKVSDTMGAIGLFVFLSAMTGARFVGTSILDRFGRVVVLRGSAVFALGGLALFGLSGHLWIALVGAVLWGVGASLGFPIGMSAASDDPQRAAARLSVVSTIGYTAFFAGPPLLGELAAHVGYRHAMLVIMIPAIVGLFVAAAAQEPAQPQDA